MGVRDIRRQTTTRRIIDAASIEFADKGYATTRLEDVAARVGMTRGGILRYFGSKDALFVEVYKEAAASLPRWLDAPEHIVDGGFFAILEYWLNASIDGVDTRTEHRIYFIGRYCTDLQVQAAISRYMLNEDPDGTLELIEFGKHRGEIRDDLDVYLAAAAVDWIFDGFEASLMSSELDRVGLFRRGDDGRARARAYVEGAMGLLRRSLGSPSVEEPGVERIRREAHPA